MVNVRTIGDKDAILQKKRENANIARHLEFFAVMKENELNAWVEKHFTGLPKAAREGIESVVNALWSYAVLTSSKRP